MTFVTTQPELLTTAANHLHVTGSARAAQHAANAIAAGSGGSEAMLDYGMLPPEINSARMYAGPGAGSMLAAAAGWDGLAGDLRSQASNYASVIAALTSDGWCGPASTVSGRPSSRSRRWLDETCCPSWPSGDNSRRRPAGRRGMRA